MRVTAMAVVWSVASGDLALTHLLWAARIWLPTGDEASLARAVVGRGERMPGPGACLLLAALLGFGASLPWWDAFGLRRAALLSLGVVLLGRGLAAYHSAWARRTPDPAFRRLDRAAYGPLCMVLAGLAATLGTFG
jgi:hypothetical protein